MGSLFLVKNVLYRLLSSLCVDALCVRAHECHQFDDQRSCFDRCTVTMIEGTYVPNMCSSNQIQIIFFNVVCDDDDNGKTDTQTDSGGQRRRVREIACAILLLFIRGDTHQSERAQRKRLERINDHLT